jgi:hypothetical protein
MRTKICATTIAIGICLVIPNSVDAAGQAAANSTKVATAAASTAAISSVATPGGTAASGTTPSAATPNLDPKEVERQIRDLGDTLKKLFNAAHSLQLECNRVYNADAIDDLVMNPWVAEPGLANLPAQPFPGALKPMPPRKKWVNHDETQITQLLRILTDEINEIAPVAKLDTSLKVSVEIMQDNLQQADAQYARLDALTNPSSRDAQGQPIYDKVAMTRATQALKDETSGINEIRKRLLRQLKEVEKK